MPPAWWLFLLLCYPKQETLITLIDSYHTLFDERLSIWYLHPPETVIMSKLFLLSWLIFIQTPRYTFLSIFTLLIMWSVILWKASKTLFNYSNEIFTATRCGGLHENFTSCHFSSTVTSLIFHVWVLAGGNSLNRSLTLRSMFHFIVKIWSESRRLRQGIVPRGRINLYALESNKLDSIFHVKGSTIYG
jgi:hypothetical protein